MERLYELASNYQIYVDEKCPQEIISMSIKFPSGAKVISLSDFQSNSDLQDDTSHPYTKLECFAHEMGHCMTDSFYELYSSLEKRSKHEYRANKWAIQYVIPFEDLCDAVSKGNTKLWQLAEYFDVSQPFIEKAVQFYEQHGNVIPKELYENE